MPWPETSTEPCVTEPVCRQPVDGINAFTVILLDDLHPAVDIPAFGDEATIAVGNADWLAEGEPLFIQYAGTYEVIEIIDTEHVKVENLGYPGNINGSGQFTVGAHVVATGLQGPAGAIGATGATGATGQQGPIGAAGDPVVFPTDSKGQIMVDTGTLPSPDIVALNAGSDGQVPAYDATTTEGIVPTTILPNTGTDNAILRQNGATGKPVPGQTSLMSVSDQGNLQAVGGDARNATATDLQTQRTATTQVASAATSTISGGRENTASGIDSTVIGGRGNLSTGLAATSGGFLSAAGGDYAFAIGYGCIAFGPYTLATGKQASALSHGQRVHSAGPFAATGDCQVLEFFLRNSTTDATPTILFLDGASIGMTLGPDGLAMGFQGFVTGRQDNGDTAYWKFEGVATVDGALALVAAVTATLIAASAGCAASWGQAARVTVTVVGVDLRITVTGTAANNIRWHCHLLTNTVVFPP